MSAPVWPAALPQDFPLSGLQETLPNVVLRTPMDVGPAKTRRRITLNVRPVKCVFVLTDTQYIALDSFFNSDCAGGALSFTWNITDPVAVQLFPAWIVDEADGIVQFLLRWTSPPIRKTVKGADLTPTASGVTQVECNFEIMP